MGERNHSSTCRKNTANLRGQAVLRVPTGPALSGAQQVASPAPASSRYLATALPSAVQLQLLCIGLFRPARLLDGIQSEVAAKLKGSATIWRLVPWASWGYIVVFSFQWHAERFTSKRHSGRQVSYFISPQAQNMVQAAVFYVVDDEDNRVGVGVFFSRATRTADHSCSALILKDGCLVGIHQEAINALRERLQHAIIVKDRLTEAEKSVDAIVNGGVAQGCYALLATFKVFNKYLTALTEATTSTFKWAAYFWQSQGLA
ncbi:hypothetical protein WJX77_008464 [Trebouxia sp. C0004]